MNNYLKEKTAGKKSMKDVFRYLYQWAKKNKRPFTMEEFPLLINKACNIDLTKIYKKWQLAIEYFSEFWLLLSDSNQRRVCLHTSAGNLISFTNSPRFNNDLWMVSSIFFFFTRLNRNCEVTFFPR